MEKLLLLISFFLSPIYYFLMGFYCSFPSYDTEGYRFIIGSARKDCRELAKLLRQSFGSKGGGSAPMIQGTVPPIALSQNIATPTASASQSNSALKTALEEFLLSQ